MLNKNFFPLIFHLAPIYVLYLRNVIAQMEDREGEG